MASRLTKSVWLPPRPFHWDYTRFGKIETAGGAAPPPDETIEMTVAKDNAARDGFNAWTINGVAFSMEKMTPMFRLRQGRRYRLHLRNASDDIHPASTRE